jgi:hypothetical protein
LLFALLGCLAFSVAGYAGLYRLIDGSGLRQRLTGLGVTVAGIAGGLSLWGYGLADSPLGLVLLLGDIWRGIL